MILAPSALAEVAAENTPFRGEALVYFVAIGLAESDGNSKAHNTNARTGDNSYGLWQVNMIGRLGPDRRKRYGLKSNNDLFVPAVNARVAYAIYAEAGYDFKPWGAFRNGAYLRRLHTARSAVESLEKLMGWRLVKSLEQLRNEANRLAPKRSKTSDGTIGDAAHRSRRSDHNPESDGTVDALDLTHDPRNGWDCNVRVAQIVQKRDRRVKYIIWNRRIWAGNEGPEPWKARPYGGKNPHTKHMHVSVLDRYQDDPAPWFKEDDDLTPEQAKQLDTIYRQLDTIYRALMEKRPNSKTGAKDLFEALDIIERMVVGVGQNLGITFNPDGTVKR